MIEQASQDDRTDPAVSPASAGARPADVPANAEPAAEPAAELPVLDMAQVKDYARIKRWCHLSGMAISLVYWLCWVGVAFSFVGWLDGFIDNRWLGLLAAVAVMVSGHGLLTLPLDYYSSFLVEHRFNLSNQTPRSWLIFQIKSWLVGGVLAAILLGGLYAAVWYGGWLWGVWLWLGLMSLSVVLAKLFPLVILPLFYPATPLNRPDLEQRLSDMAGQAGMTLTGVYNLGLSQETKKANAMLAGLGSTRRVYLSDTLVGAFDADQIAVVFAHELGHHIHRHIFKMIGLTAAVTSVLVTLIWWRINPYAGPEAAWSGAVAAFAQIMLISTIYPLLIAPVTNAISRHFERQADWKALEMTDNPGAFRGTFELLTRMNLADPDPPRWEEILFDDHPATGKRIAMANAYERSRS